MLYHIRAPWSARERLARGVGAGVLHISRKKSESCLGCFLVFRGPVDHPYFVPKAPRVARFVGCSATQNLRFASVGRDKRRVYSPPTASETSEPACAGCFGFKSVAGVHSHALAAVLCARMTRFSAMIEMVAFCALKTPHEEAADNSSMITRGANNQKCIRTKVFLASTLGVQASFSSRRYSSTPSASCACSSCGLARGDCSARAFNCCLSPYHVTHLIRAPLVPGSAHLLVHKLYIIYT